ncbi:MAG: hypothetical protein SXQ77_03900, partial [Halobacteria archaeon]|nr:hypothetical protein [Halobacteria archaeon]
MSDSTSTPKAEIKSPAVYECRSCDNLVLAIQPSDVDCCNESMKKIDIDDTDVNLPDLKTVLNNVFDMSDVEKEMCLYLMQEGDSTIPEMAEDFEL